MSSGEKTRVYGESGKVVLSVHDFYTNDQATDSIATAFTLFQSYRQCEFVVDLVHMTGFESGARVQWQEHLSAMRPHIKSVVMVGGSPLARMSGAAVCLYAGLKMRFVDRLEDVFGSQRSA